MQICSCETCFKLLSIFLFLLLQAWAPAYCLGQSESLLFEIFPPLRRPTTRQSFTLLVISYWLVQSESLLCEISLPCEGRQPVSLLLYWSFLIGWSSRNLYTVRFPSLAEADGPSVFLLYWSFLTVWSSRNLYSVRFSSLAEADDPSVLTVHKGNHMSPFFNLEH